MPNPGTTGTTPDKIDTHNRQQLSALVDGALSPDEARFMLRRLEHDEALAGCHERWQLLGDVLRGQACAPAPLDFAARVRGAVAAEPAPLAAAAVVERTRERRSGWRRWGGGAALAASVAAVAMFMTREQLPSQTPLDTPATTVIARQAEMPPAPSAPAPTPAPASMDAAVAVAAVPAAAVAAASRRQDVAAVRRASATRTQQAARSAGERSAEPQRAVASQPVHMPALPAASSRQLPFGDVAALQAKPWPRSTLAPAAGGALNASFSAQEPQAAFYPFEPRLQEVDPAPATPRRHRD